MSLTKVLPGLAGRLLLAAAVFWTAASATGERRSFLEPEVAQQIWGECIAQQKAGHFSKALSLIHKLLRAYPDSPIYLSFEAGLYNKLRDYRKEAAVWELFVDVAPFPTDACPQLGRAYGALGLEEEAFKAHRRCYEFEPTNADMKFFYGHALEGRGDPEAERLYRAILDRYPGYHDAALGLARIRMQAGRLSEAESLVMGVVRKAPKTPDALLVWALIAEKTGKRGLAEAKLREAIEISPSYADLHRILARLYEASGNRRGALLAYEALIRLEPENVSAQARLRELKEKAP